MSETSHNSSSVQDVAANSPEAVIDKFLDAIWMERGLSKNTLGAYRADLMTLGRGLSKHNKSIEQAEPHPPGAIASSTHHARS